MAQEKIRRMNHGRNLLLWNVQVKADPAHRIQQLLTMHQQELDSGTRRHLQHRRQNRGQPHKTIIVRSHPMD